MRVYTQPASKFGLRAVTRLSTLRNPWEGPAASPNVNASPKQHTGVQRRQSKGKETPSSVMFGHIRQVFGGLVMLAVCGTAIHMGLQTLAIAGLAGFTLILFKNTARELIDVGIRLLSRAERARFGDFELRIRKDLSRLGSQSQHLAQEVAWAEAILSELSPGEIGLLLTIARAERLKTLSGTMHRLRNLRNAGLLNHETSSLSTSEHVWLSDLGKQLANLILQARSPGHQGNASE